MNTVEIIEYRKIDKALVEMDIEWARRKMPYAINDTVRLCAMHKARYEITTINNSLRKASRDWLEKRHYSRYGGLPWPPDDQLPE